MVLQITKIDNQRVYVDSAAPTTVLTGDSTSIPEDGGKLAADAAAAVSQTGVGNLSSAARNVETELDTNAANIAANTANIATNTSNISALDSRVTVNEGNITTNASAIATLQSERTRWMGAWQSATTYQARDQVNDEGWLMIANKATTERPAPQPYGDPVWMTGLGDTPLWDTQVVNGATRLLTGLRINVESGGWSLGGRFWLPTVNANIEYEAWLVNNPTSGAPIYTPLAVLLNQEDAWIDAGAEGKIVRPGDQFDLWLIASSQAGQSTWSGVWDLKHGGGAPGSGESNFYDNNTRLRIHYTDKNSDDWTTELQALQVGETVAFGGITYNITSITQNASDADMEVTPQTRPSEGEYTFLFTVSEPTDLEYVRVADQLLGRTDARGLFQLEGGSLTETDFAYGVDWIYQPASVSVDWDYQSYDAGTSGGGSGAPSEVEVLASAVWDYQQTPAQPYDITTDRDNPTGPWMESGDESGTELTNRLADLNGLISQYGSKGGKIEIPSGLYQVNGRVVMKDGVAINGAGGAKTWLSTKSHTGTAISPEYAFAPSRLEEWLAETSPPRARHQINYDGGVVFNQERPQFQTELSHLSIQGGDGINDRPSKWEGARDISHHGVALGEGGQYIHNARIMDFAGTGLIMYGGDVTAQRYGGFLEVDAVEMWLHRLYIRKCLGGLWVDSGDDYHIDHVIIGPCRDYGMRVSTNTLTCHNTHIFGCNQGLLLDDGSTIPGHGGGGKLYFTGKTEFENCYQWGMRNRTHDCASFDLIRTFGNKTATDYSNATLQAVIDLEAPIICSKLVANNDQAGVYVIQNRGADGTQFNGGRIENSQGVTGALGVHHNAHGSRYSLEFTGSQDATNIGFEFAGGQRNEVILSTWQTQGTLLNIHAGSNNYFRTYGGVVNVWTDQTTFEAAGNKLDAFGSTVNWSTPSTPQAPNT